MAQHEPSYSLPLAQPDQAFMHVSALEAGHMTTPLSFLIAGSDPGASLSCPSLSFILRHSKLDKRIVFDLGARRDYITLPPAVVYLLTRTFGDTPPVRLLPSQTADESLVKGGLEPSEIDAVVISHLHFDHIGDPRPFTKATFVVGGECKALLDTGYPTDPKSLFATDTFPPDRTRFLSRSDYSTSIGPFPHAHDYFGDGSMYVVDTPGHLPGHVSVLARTSADGAWILLGGDAAHHFRIITGEAQIACWHSGGVSQCAHADKEVAEESIWRIRQLLEIPRVQVLIAHDVDWYNANKDGEAFFPGKIPALV